MVRLLAALVALAVAGLAISTVRSTIGVEAARDDIRTRLEALTGLSLTVTGSGTTRLLPWPGIRFDDVAVSTDDGRVLARMEALDAEVDVAALLLGRLHAETLRLVRPEIHLARGDLRPTLEDVARRLAAWEPVDVVIEKGRIDDTRSGETVDAVDARFSWPRPSSRATLAAVLRWRGETVDLAVEIPPPARVFGASPEAWSLRLASPLLRLAISGVGGPRAAARFEGSGDIEVIDAARFGRWAGWPGVPDLLGGRLRLDGRLDADAAALTMPAARIDLAGNQGTGALSLRWDKDRPRFDGTVAFTGLDLTTGRRGPIGPGWRELPLPALARDSNVDLRFSARKLRLPDVTLTDVAGALLLAEGRIHAEIGEARFFDKPMSLVVRGFVGPRDLRAQVRANGDDLPAAELANLFALPGITAGRAAIALEADLSCGRLGACLGGLDGRLSLDLRGATVTGASPFSEISRFRPIIPQANGPTVTTEWQRAEAALRLRGAAMTVDRVVISGRDARFLFSGTGDLATGAIDLSGNAYFPAARLDPSRTGTSDVMVPMRVGGTLRRPEFLTRDAPTAPGAPTTGESTAPPPP